MEKPINAALRNQAMGRLTTACIILVVMIGLHALVFSSVWKTEQKNETELTALK
jgi:hypothetical protein